MNACFCRTWLHCLYNDKNGVHMKRKLFITTVIFAGIFMLLFLFRLFYGYLSHPGTGESGGRIEIQQNSGVSYAGKRNIATARYREKAVTVDQKYEKIANISSLSNEFEEDEKKIRSAVKNYNALIQYENKSGLKGRRTLDMRIGVPPRSFDTVISELRLIGKLTSIDINKKDKTNEYRELNARQKTLLKTRISLLALKNRNASVEELIKLENRILEIENEIQGLGVSLGEFDEENEFCTVNMKVMESAFSGRISFIHRVKVALEWTVSIYLKLCFTFFMAVLIVNLVLSMTVRFKIAERIKNLFS